ncbi:PQQ-binding-like beta-propeller repeat protein [Thermofilum sp.]|uniref:outer membrane protein assembly factor BamB family protein n=1 Tax=Thermofilum sp. TaxID=1961369 RepID=UPI00317C05F4
MPLFYEFRTNIVAVDINGEERVYAFTPTSGDVPKMRCYDFDGNLKWESNIPGIGEGSFIGITKDGSVLYAWNVDEIKAYGFDALNGDTLWSISLSAANIISVGPDDCAYYIGGVYPTFDLIAKVNKQGNVLWSRTLGRGGDTPQKYSWGAVSSDNTALYIVQLNQTLGRFPITNNVWLIKINPSNGEEIWAIDLLDLYGENWGYVLGLTEDDEVVVANYGKIYCFNPDSTLKWVTESFNEYGFLKLFARDLDGTLYVSNGVSIWKCNPGNGNLTHVHDAQPDEIIRTMAVDKSKRIYYGTYTYVRCLNNNGDLIWETEFPYSYCPTALAICKSRLFVSTSDNVWPNGLFCYSQ